MKPTLLKEIWSLWESMAECGELSIGPQFSAQYKRLKIEVEEALIIDEVRRNRLKSYHKKWRDKPESKDKIKKYNAGNREWHQLKYLAEKKENKSGKLKKFWDTIEV